MILSLIPLLAFAGTTLATTPLNLALKRPDSAKPVPGDLAGLSIEADRFPAWAGNGTERNEFTYTLLNNLKEKTGVPPYIRIGGGSQDHIISTPNVTDGAGYYNVFDPVPRPHDNTKALFPQARFTGAGLKYWLSSCNLPRGTRFAWGANLLAGNASEAVAQVQQIERVFEHPSCNHVELHTIELGNEADLWGDGERRPTNWTIQDYADEQLEYFDAISAELGEHGRKYRVADFAGRFSSSWLNGTGLLHSRMARSINAISEHRYQGAANMDPPSTWPETAAGLINKTNIRSRLDKFDSALVTAQDAGIEFVLGETGSFSGHGQSGVSNAAAAAIWMVDYTFQAATRGIAGLHFHQGVGYNYSAFVPIDHVGVDIETFDPDAVAHVMPLYYGYLMVADAIGKSGKAFVSEVATDLPTLAAYQVWEKHQPARLVLINSEPWAEGTPHNRPQLSIRLPGIFGKKRLRYKTLYVDSIVATEGLIWGGQSWETSTGRPRGRESFKSVDARGVLGLDASSIAVVYLD